MNNFIANFKEFASVFSCFIVILSSILFYLLLLDSFFFTNVSQTRESENFVYVYFIALITSIDSFIEKKIHIS